MATAFSFTGRIRSVRYGLRGVKIMLATQHNAWVHAAATLTVIAAACLLHVSATDWALLFCAIIAVWTAEGLNTAFELLCDVASPEFHPIVEKAKDVAAGAVLMSALGSIAIGALVFCGPIKYLLD